MVSSAPSSQPRVLALARRSDDVRAEMTGELNGEMAHAASRPRDEHPLPRLDGRGVREGLPRGHRGHREGPGLLLGEDLGRRDEIGRRDDDALGVRRPLAREPRQAENALDRCEPRGTRAGRADRARHVPPRREGQGGGSRRRHPTARAGHDIDRVEARRGRRDEDLVRAQIRCRRRLDLDDLQGLGPAEAALDDPDRHANSSAVTRIGGEGRSAPRRGMNRTRGAVPPAPLGRVTPPGAP